MSDVENLDKNNSTSQETLSVPHRKAKEHAKQLQRLQEKDPEFYQYLKDHDKELLEFNDGEDDEDQETALESDVKSQLTTEKVKKPSAKAITTEMVDSWCRAIKDGKLGAVQSLLRAFRTACHCGDDAEDGSTAKFSIISSSVFNKIMVFVLNEMDEILRGLLKAPKYGGKKETIMDLTTTKPWGKYGSLMRLYLGNSLHILTEMTDEQMIAFTLKRVKASAVFLAAFPVLLRKYIQVALHSWGTGRGALPVISFLFLRDLCVRIGPECIETCLRGVYKAYVSVCRLSKSVSRSKLQQIDFLGNCVTELYGVDLSTAYQQAFLFIRQLAVVLRGTLTERGGKAVKDNPKGKKQKGNNSTKQQVEKAYQKVYDWQFINCLELWTRVICSYGSEADFQPLAYPLTQLIYGVACLVPTARYFPLRLRCVRMLNRIAGATGSFIPVSALLLDMLEMKELNSPPTGGVGKAVNLLSVKQVDKTTLKTRAFQENCVYSIVEELSEHLAQWSYSVGFFELSFIPLVRLRSFCKATKVDRFRREIKELIRQAEANCEFTNSRRVGIKFSPNDPAADSFLKAEKESGSSPLSKFVANLHLRTKQRADSMDESSVIVGAESSVFGNKLSKDTEDDAIYGDDDNDVDEAAAVFSSSWLPEKKSKVIKETLESTTKQEQDEEHDDGGDEDILEDLVLSSDDDDNNNDDNDGDDGDDDREAPRNDSASEEEEHGSSKQENKKRKPVTSANHRGKKQKLASASASLKKRSRPKNKKKKGSRH